MTTTQNTESTFISEETGFSFGLWHLSLVLIAIGIAITGYLVYNEITAQAVVCAEGEAFNCDAVQHSAYSKIAGIPIVYPGFLTYVLLGALVLLENRLGILQEYGKLLVFGITLFAFVFSVYLVYLQLFVLQALCQWCIGHEIIMTILFFVSGIRIWRELTTD